MMPCMSQEMSVKGKCHSLGTIRQRNLISFCGKWPTGDIPLLEYRSPCLQVQRDVERQTAWRRGLRAPAWEARLLSVGTGLRDAGRPCWQLLKEGAARGPPQEPASLISATIAADYVR